MRYIFFFTWFSLVFVQTAVAQSVKQLKEQENITWIGEAYFYYAVDTSSYLHYGGYPEGTDNRIKTLKVQQPNGLYIDGYHNSEIYYQLLDRIVEEEVELYPTDELKTALTMEEVRDEIKFVDTITIFDPLTFEEIPEIIVNYLNPEDTDRFIIKQLIYYNTTTKMFYAIPQAVGMLRSLYTDNGVYVDDEVIFWFPVTNEIQGVDYMNSANITWAKRTYHNSLLRTDIEVLKGDKTWEEMMNVVFTENNALVKNKQLLSSTAVGEMSAPFKNTKQLEEHLGARKLSTVQFIHDWYWDEEKNAFSVHYVGFGVVDAEEEVLYYRRNGEVE